MAAKKVTKTNFLPGINDGRFVVRSKQFNELVDYVNATVGTPGTGEFDIISEETSGAGVTFTDELKLANGTAAAPSATFASDTNTGIYRSAADQVGVTTGGTGQVIFTNGTIEPVTDNDIDLGSTTKEFKDLWIDGTANIDALVADTADINGGTVDGATVGATSPSSGAFTTVAASTSATVTSASAVALAVGLAGATNPSFVVDSSTGTQAAGLKVTGAVAAGTVAAAVVSSGADASLSIDAKGTGTLTLQGTATGNIVVGDDIVPDVDNTLDIGNLTSNNRDIHASRAFIKKGLAPAADGYGQLALKSITASKVMAGGGTEVIAVQVPAGALLVAAQLRNDTTIVGAGAATYSAAYSTGSTQAISSGTSFADNTKVNKFFDVNAATAITSGATDITLTPNAGTLDTGTVTAVVYYYELTSMTDAA